ncbi:HAD hydrolase family protein [Salinibacterium sp. SYSU T00001]|uniref:HAD family hydrolase n=1 Tax=Homoserinimonas sedimenticola TaxID=2986805 RepID=UPI0022365F46|nr:HAD hydrolase family protein [Salinibacterium sedimenticola]MCW4385891.1 HAD hydrolase family protein [Salinibacterium sedimenticola]
MSESVKNQPVPDSIPEPDAPDEEVGPDASVAETDAPWLVALDVDGTIMLADGTITPPVAGEVARLRDAGHEVMIATGRAVSMTLPVIAELEIEPEYLVCSNGAVTMRRDPDAPLGYTRAHVETFDPTGVLTAIHDRLEGASFAVEDEHGHYRYVGEFPNASLGLSSTEVEFEDLLGLEATRVVVLSFEHGQEEFLSIVEEIGLHKVSYNIGWTAWLDIAPDGVNKATGMERVREWLDWPRSRVLAVGDGRNDLELLEWAATLGRGVAMGQAPEEVKAAANEVTGSDDEDGLAAALAQVQ